MATKIFFDTEFTGLHQNTTLISIGCVSENDDLFYGEFTDYDKSQIDDWLKDNVLAHLMGAASQTELSIPDYAYIGNAPFIKDELLKWFAQFDEVELWSDCLSFDWVLLSELIADRRNGYPQLPGNFIYHSPFDILTVFNFKGLDYDVTRESFAYGSLYQEMLDKKHNALWDAQVIKACYDKLMAK